MNNLFSKELCEEKKEQEKLRKELQELKSKINMKEFRLKAHNKQNLPPAHPGILIKNNENTPKNLNNSNKKPTPRKERSLSLSKKTPSILKKGTPAKIKAKGIIPDNIDLDSMTYEVFYTIKKCFNKKIIL